MKGINITDAISAEITAALFGNKEVKVQESEQKDEVKDIAAPEHVCPLCESTLKEALTDEKIQEHVDYFLSIINENFEIDGDSLDEDEESEDE